MFKRQYYITVGLVLLVVLAVLSLPDQTAGKLKLAVGGLFLPLFGMGLRRFSMSPAFIPTVKALLASVTTAQAERFAHQVLQLKTSGEIRSYLTARLHEISSALEVFDST